MCLYLRTANNGEATAQTLNMANTEENEDYVDLRVPVSPVKKEKLKVLAKEQGQDLSNFLRPFIYRIADGDLTLVINSKR